MKKQGDSIFMLSFYCFILCFFISYFTYSQPKEILKSILNLNTSIENRIIKADSLINTLENNNHDSIEYTYHDYAYWLYNKTNINDVINLEEKANSIAKNRTPLDNAFLQNSSSDLAFYYKRNSQLDKTIELYNRSILYDKSNLRNLSTIYNSLGSTYYQINDYNKALKYYELAASLFHQLNRLKSLRAAYYNIAKASLFIEEESYLKKGIFYAKKADSLTNILTKSRYNLLNKRILGRLYNQDVFLAKDAFKGHYNDAFYLSLSNHQEVLNISLKNKDTFNIIQSYIELGNLYNLYDKQKSIKYLEKAIPYNKKRDSFVSYQINANIGHTQSIHDDYEKSIENRLISLEYLTGIDFKDFLNIEYSSLDNTNPNQKNLLIVGLPFLSETYLNYYRNNDSTIFIDRAISYFRMADYIIDLSRSDSNEFKSRLFWRRLSADIYGKAIKACYLGGNIEDAFYFMEKNKALLLLEDIYNKSFKRQSQLPPKILEKHNHLKKEIALTNNLLVDESRWSKIELDSLKKQRIDLEIELAVLEDDNDITYEVLDIEASILSLKEVQENLKANEVAIEYHISIDDGFGILTNKDNGYALFITKNDTQLFEINNLDQLKSEITSLTNALKSPFNTQNDINEFNGLSNTIYNKLFPSDKIKQLIKGKTLTIAPDSYLSLLPFEALSTNADSTSYLIRNSEIHYVYSNSFIKNIKSSENKSKVKSLGIAPVSFNNTELNTLNNSLNEVKSINQYYSGSTLLNEQANKSNFLNALNTTSNGIVHIASHANVQDKVAPWIAFHDESITLEELYLTQNNASLVVLSGCNTSLGEQEVGEGVMSLARGFFYSGSQSVISSLWSIDDRSTSEIVNSFYKNLSEGQTKSKALHNAKIEYLDNHSGSETSPYFWASLILLGQNDTLEPSNSYWVFFIIGGLFIILRAYFLRKK